MDPADPDARNEGFEGGAGLFDELPGACRVAIAVGKTNDGESLPANLCFPGRLIKARGGRGRDKGVPHFCVSCAIVDHGGELASHSSETSSEEEC